MTAAEEYRRLAAAERLSSGLCVNCGNPVVSPRHWRGDAPVHVECLSKLRTVGVDTCAPQPAPDQAQ